MVSLLTTCESHDVSITGRSDEEATPLSGAGLSLFFQESQDSLHHVTLDGMVLSAEELDLRHRGLVDDDAAEVFVECLHQSDRGPIDLSYYNIDSQIIASALADNSRVTKLKPHSESRTDADMAILVAALANNRGLVNLDLEDRCISDDNWSIYEGPSYVDHFGPPWYEAKLYGNDDAYDEGLLSDEPKVHRVRAIAEMVQHNTVLYTIMLSGDEQDDQIYDEEISPYLETNRYRPRLLAIKKADIQIRRALLGVALQTKSVSPE
jgi:hypothetical protein